ncbi:hypothetical protein AAFF_G00271840 [Aldrovandia affinis]|uniref:Uncharacterized protein n=1 Tax=Aldrovandia affinis TaxID=143900 RepID=A0AAD7RAW8_9TELE|nr:hypothetical protein AAFF_G00271840 [Aldrovandia affinis]
MLAWILLGTAFCVEGFRHENRTQLSYGRDLIVPLSMRAVVLYFSPLHHPHPPVTVWNIGLPGTGRGEIEGTRWILRSVTYADQGQYSLYDGGNKLLSSVILTVREERNHLDRVVNASMTIFLHVPLADAQLSFIPEGTESNFTLVRYGQVATPDEAYYGRLKLGLSKIVLTDLMLDDSGQYELRDRALNLVSTTRLRVSETYDTSGNPYLALLALLGVAGGAFCCWRKKCCKKKAPHIQGGSALPSPGQPDAEGQVFYHPTPNDPSQPNWTGPVGPPPNWAGPGGPPQPNWTGPVGPPQPDWSGPVGPPQPNWSGPPHPNYGTNPPNVPYMYPPANPGPQPQWTPGPQNMGYAPVMYSAPPTASEPVKEALQQEATATDNLSAHTEETGGDAKPAPASAPFALGSDCLHSSESGVQFQIDKGSATKEVPASENTNFL